MKYLVFIIFAILIVLGIGSCSLNGIHYQTGKGEHTGFITAVERNGLIWKTGTAYIKTDVSSSQEDKYCVTDPAVYNQLEALAKDRQKVTVKYQDFLVKGLTQCDGEDSIIYGIN